MNHDTAKGADTETPCHKRPMLDQLRMHKHSETAGVCSRAIQEIERLRKEVDECSQALRAIAYHPHCNYEHPENNKFGPSDRQYAIGVADGHRCAAKVARKALGVEVEE